MSDITYVELAPPAVASQAVVNLNERLVARERGKEGDVRRRIALFVVRCYFVIVVLSILGPVLVVAWLGDSVEKIAAIRDLGETISPALGGVLGVLGFVLGYYFKSEDKKDS